MKGKSLAAITSTLTGKPYALGDPGAGYDCFNLVHQYLTLKGADLPTQFEGETIRTYADLFRRAPVKAKKLMVEYVASVTDEIPVSRAFAGDILLLALKERKAPAFLGIHGGGGNVLLSSPEHGVTVCPLGKYEIRRAFRCRAPFRL